MIKKGITEKKVTEDFFSPALTSELPAECTAGTLPRFKLQLYKRHWGKFLFLSRLLSSPVKWG